MKRRSLRESLKKYVVDTSVLAEYIIRDAVYRNVVEKLFNDALKKTIELYVTPYTISELIYVSSRIYKIALLENSNEEALNFVEWLNTRVKYVQITGEISIEAGELRKRFNIALTDCYVIAAAVKLQAKALFLKPEREMLEKIEELRELPIAFLAEDK
ncbi:MAG: PIN domain-containing protein [Nitrososphaeria archaeon]|nr:PIN domain-containing protein [Nitrososphaeria archaeon]